MITIVVQSPGMFTTVQDLGRPGYGPLGVSTSGAADPLALRLGNRLLGNPQGAPALELTLLGGTFVFPEGGRIAITGADFGASVPMWQAVSLDPGQAVRLGPSRTGARAYLCVQGGIEIPLFLGSASTHALSGLGGKVIRKGDVLTAGQTTGDAETRPIRPDIISTFYRKAIRVTLGPQTFSPEAEATFFSAAYKVSEQSNRMGIRLAGPSIETPHAGQMPTEGVSLGAIQVPAGGHPIILFVEQQTTGGYPKIANVIAADLPSLGQLRPRDEIRFELTDDSTARQLLRAQESLLNSEEIFT